MSAAARLSTLGLANKQNPVMLYSSVPLRSFRDNPRDEDGGQALLNRISSNSQSLKPAQFSVQRSTKGCGVKFLSEEVVHERFKKRRKMVDTRLKICGWSVCVALFGLFLAVVDVELLVAWGHLNEIIALSFGIRLVIIILTAALDLLIIAYHRTEIEIISADTGQVPVHMTRRRRLKICVELLICSCCPYPTQASVDWPTLGEGASLGFRAHIPLNVILTIPMYFRLYFLCRYMVLRSVLIKNTATRAIASFNQVSVDFVFVLKSLICKRPLTFVLVVSITFWSSSSWILTQCERYAGQRNPNLPTTYFLVDYAWFEAVTFFAIGYGDMKVETYCGRTLAITTGLVGSLFSSLITVLLSQRMLLSLAERRVNQVIAESKLSILHRHAAARVLQSTWRVVRWQKRLESCEKPSKSLMLHLRLVQRRFLRHVFEFRQCRWKLRLRMEQEDDIITVQRAFSETEDRLKTLRVGQQQLNSHLQTLVFKTDRLASVFMLTRCRQKLQKFV